MASNPAVHIFDFDGVLAVPYTQPELLFPGAERLLKQLKEKENIVLVASFNPRAYTVTKHLFDEGVIDDIRAGCNDQRWWLQDDGVYRDAEHRRLPLSKVAMIRDMIRLLATAHRRVHFYDDDEENILAVRTALPHVTCHHVTDWSRGLLKEYETVFGFSLEGTTPF